MAYAYTFQYTPGTAMLDRNTNRPVIIYGAIAPKTGLGVVNNGPSNLENYVVADLNGANERILNATELLAAP